MAVGLGGLQSHTVLIFESMIEIDLISYWKHPHVGILSFAVKLL